MSTSEQQWHTADAGDWYVGNDDVGSFSWQAVFDNPQGEGFPVALCVGEYTPGKAGADTELGRRVNQIKALPDLLTALEDLVAATGSLVPSHCPEWDAASAALRKARGEQEPT